MEKLTETDRLAIAKRLAVMDRQMIIGVREVAVLYNTTIASVQQACSKKRIARGDVTLKLPPQVNGLGRRVAWFHGDVRDLLTKAQAASPATWLQVGAPTGPASSRVQDGATPAEPLKDKKRMGRKRQA